MLNIPVCYLVWMNHQVPVHKQECLLESSELLHQVLLSTAHSHPLPLRRPRTSLDLLGLGTGIGAVQSQPGARVPCSNSSCSARHGPECCIPTASLNFQIMVGQKSLASLPVPWSLGGFKEGTMSITALSCRVELQLELFLRTEKLRVKLKLSFPLCVQVLHWRD